MNKKNTFNNIEINCAKDGVWDVYIDGVWNYSRTSLENVVDEFNKIVKEIYDEE